MTLRPLPIRDDYTGHVETRTAARRTLPGVGIIKISVGPMDNNAYLVTCAETGVSLLIDAANDPNVLEVVEEVVELGKEKVETGRLRIYNVVSEAKVAKSIDLVDETVTVQRRAVNRAALEDAFKERVFELSEFDERAIVSKRAQVVEEVNLAKQAEAKGQTVTETVRRSDVRAERIGADGKVIETVATTER